MKPPARLPARLFVWLLALGCVPAAQAQAQEGRGRGLSPAQLEARQKQESLEKSVPQIPFDSVPPRASSLRM